MQCLDSYYLVSPHRPSQRFALHTTTFVFIHIRRPSSFSFPPFHLKIGKVFGMFRKERVDSDRVHGVGGPATLSESAGLRALHLSSIGYSDSHNQGAGISPLQGCHPQRYQARQHLTHQHQSWTCCQNSRFFISIFLISYCCIVQCGVVVCCDTLCRFMLHIYFNSYLVYQYAI